MARLFPCTARACAVLAVVLCGACARPPHPGHDGSPAPGKPLGHSGCGPPLTYQVFQHGAFRADWSKANDLIAFNAKGNHGVDYGLFHVNTAKRMAPPRSR